jgi:prepilin-type N-terminal cleavage/methylation domain-containing protein
MTNDQLPMTIRHKISAAKPHADGFTLIELLIYVAILVIVSSLAVAFAFWGIRINSNVKAKAEVQNNSRRAMEIMAYEIRQAQSIYTPTSVFSAHPGQLSVKTLLDAPSGETKAYKDFYLDNGKIYFKREGQLPEALTSDQVRVTNLMFKHIAPVSSPEGVQINLTMEYNNPSARPDLEAREELFTFISLRAY